MKKMIGSLVICIGMFLTVAYADVVLDNFDNDRSQTNGTGIDASWNPPPDATFKPEIETTKIDKGKAALKVTWANKDLWPNMVIAELHKSGNNGKRFADAETVRMAIAGPAGRIILKLADSTGAGTGDLGSATVSGSDQYELYEFPYANAISASTIDITKIAEMQLLIDAGQAGTNGTIYIDSIELINGTGDDAEVVALIDNFDNDSSLADDLNNPDSVPSGSTLLAGGPFVTTVVNDPAGTSNAVLKVDYNTSPWSVLWVQNLDITDWSPADGISIDVYGSANGILLKLKDADGKEQEPSGGLVNHEGDQWDTFTWGFEGISSIDITRMGKLIVFVEGPSGGQGTIYFDNLKLIGAITKVSDWSLR